jgi:protease I
MTKAALENFRVAVLAMDGVEEAEITETTAALKAAGARVDVVSKRRQPLQAFVHMAPSIMVPVDATFEDLDPEAYDAVLLPGGALNSDALRVEPQAQAFVTAFDRTNKPIAAICHAPWLLVSADLVEGRTLTSFHTIHDDIENAGGTWLDQPVVADGNLVTSRKPDDIPQFNERMIALFERSVRVPV